MLMLVLQLLYFLLMAEYQCLVLASNDPEPVIDIGHLSVLSIQFFSVIDDEGGKIAFLESFEYSSLFVGVKATGVDM